MKAHRSTQSDTPEAEPYKLYVLRKSKYHQAVLDEHSIFFSKTLKHFVTFKASIFRFYPRAILRVVEFGDLTLDPRLPKFNNG